MNESRDDAADAVLARLQPGWTSSRTERNLALTFDRLARASRLRRLGAVGAVGAALAVATVGVVARRPSGGPAFSLRAPDGDTREAGPRVVRFAEGSSVALGEPGARAVIAAATPARIEVQLAEGPAAFDVTASRSRVFVVKVARVEVRVAGARFGVVPQGERVKLSVVEGEVEVAWAERRERLRAGATAWFPPPPEEGAHPVGAAAPAGPRARFRFQVAHRDYAGAYQSLVATPGLADHSAEDLMLAADAARLSHHPADAVPYFRRLLREHAGDARAPLAAFTLGRILLAELARPAEAAEAFGLSRRLAPAGALAPDALAREAEAAARAGDPARARALAQEYARRYPAGARAAEVRRSGGLE